MYYIQDWTGAIKFEGTLFEDFETAEEFLSEFLGDNYEEDRQEFYIEEVNIGKE